MVSERPSDRDRESYAHVLGAVGSMLDDAGTLLARVDLAFWGSHLSMSAQEAGHPGWRRSRSIELDALRAQARSAPRATSPSTLGDHAARLRAIGRQLDEQGVRLERLTIGPTSYRVLGRLRAYTFAQWFPREYIDLVA
jgi:hypothetical protein